jgi:hypothetical protein
VTTGKRSGLEVIEDIFQSNRLRSWRNHLPEMVARSAGRGCDGSQEREQATNIRLRFRAIAQSSKSAGGMSVEWKVGRTRRQSGKLDIERVPAARDASIAGCAKCLRDVTTKEMKTSAWRTLLDPLHC